MFAELHIDACLIELFDLQLADACLYLRPGNTEVFLGFWDVRAASKNAMQCWIKGPMQGRYFEGLPFSECNTGKYFSDQHAKEIKDFHISYDTL